MAMDPEKKVEIEALSGLIDGLNYYQILKVEQKAPPGEIKRSFLRESQKFHPDRYFNVSDEGLKTNVTKIYKRIAEAYQILRNPDHRADYDKQIASDPQSVRYQLKEKQRKGPSGSVEAQAKNPQAKKFLQLAVNCMKKKDYSGAEMNLQFALKFEPGNAGIQKKLDEARAERAKNADKADPYKIR